MLVIDTRIKLLLFILINFMVFGLKDFILGSVCFFFICILSCLMGQKKDCIEIPYLLCGDCGHTAALRLPSPGHRNYFVDLHIVYSGDDTRGTLCLNLYRYNESQRIDCGHVLAKNSSEHYHYIRYGIALFFRLSVRRSTISMTR